MVTTLALFAYLYWKPDPQILTPMDKELSETTTGIQSRNRVRKDIWVAQSAQERLHNQVESKTSSLLLQPTKTSLEIVEQFHHVKGWIQEKDPSQGNVDTKQVRYFEAETGTYLYQEKHFSATDVSLAIYKVPAASFLFSLNKYRPFLKGTAEEIAFSFEEKAPVFQATRFKASLGDQ